MNSSNYTIIILLSVSSFFSCQEDEALIQQENIRFTDILLSISEVEYALYMEDDEYTSVVLLNLDEQMELCDKLICASSEEKLIEINENLLYVSNNINIPEKEHLLDKLRKIKGQVMKLETDDDYDPYLYMIWQYEAEMYYATKAAMDPMLDLYEWGEFVSMTECMNDSWERVMYHYPSSETLGQDQGHYRNQISKKIRLDRAMKQFNYVVYSDDAPEYSLCEAGEELRNSYINYLRALLMIDDSTNLYLA